MVDEPPPAVPSSAAVGAKAKAKAKGEKKRDVIEEQVDMPLEGSSGANVSAGAPSK